MCDILDNSLSHSSKIAALKLLGKAGVKGVAAGSGVAYPILGGCSVVEFK